MSSPSAKPGLSVLWWWALALLVVNLATLVWVFTRPMPDLDAVPGRKPVHDLGAGGRPNPDAHPNPGSPSP